MIEDFRIADVEAAPGRVGICRLPGRSGALAADLASIAEWRPALLLSLTEATEMEALGARGLTEGLSAAGIAWRHFPIIDYGVPAAEDAVRWRGLAAELHAALDAGASVLVHCRGGLGRSGMVAARLLAERGDAQALARVRSARPGAIETAAQEAWALAGATQTKPTTGLGR